MDILPENQVKFGLFQFNLQTGELKKNGEPLRLQAQPARVLSVLVSRAGALVTRQEIQQEVWGENFVAFDQGLNFCIRQIRIALGDQAEAPVYIETVPRQGYRFIAPVSHPPALPAQTTPATGPADQPVQSAVQAPLRRRWRPVLTIVAGIVLTGLIVTLWLVPRRTALQGNERLLLAVLPFDNFTGDAQQEHFCDGLTEELIATLSRLNPQRLGVIARTSAMRYKTEKKPISQIRTELGADFLIEGSVRNEAGQLRITVQLIRASDQSHLWALSFDRAKQDMLSVQREVAESVARSFSIDLLPATTRRTETHNPQAREAYLKGRYQLGKGTGAAARQALTFFQQAVSTDPNYAEAWVGLAAAQMRQPGNPRELLPQVRASLKRARELDDSLAEAWCLSGVLAMKYELDWALARREFERAVELEPGRARTQHEFAFYYSNLGLHDEAIARLQKALELDPVSPLVQGDLGWLYLRAHRYDEAERQCLKTIELEPKDIGAHYCLFHTYRLQGKWEEAARKGREVMTLVGAKPDALALLDAGDARQRLTAYHRWELAWLLDSGARGYLDPAVLAMSYADLGQTEPAMQCLLRAEREGSDFLSSLRAELRYDPLRSDPRFVALLNRLFPRPD